MHFNGVFEFNVRLRTLYAVQSYSWTSCVRPGVINLSTTLIENNSSFRRFGSALLCGHDIESSRCLDLTISQVLSVSGRKWKVYIAIATLLTNALIYFIVIGVFFYFS